MALDAVAGSYESILAVMAGAARFALVHIAHGCLECTGLEREGLGVTVGALVHAEMEFMAEVCFTGFGLEKNVGWFVPLVAFVALAGYRKGVLAVVADAARFALLHACHGRLERA